MDLAEIGVNARNMVHSAQDRNYWRALVNSVLNIRIPEVVELVKGIMNFNLYSK
jgi:hypothetical protein